jgi:uncharacterized protein (DUF342 family)
MGFLISTFWGNKMLDRSERDAFPKIERGVNFSNTGFNLTVSHDKMKAYIIFKKTEDGKIPSLEDILESINKNGIVHGINMDILETALKFPVYDQMICIAEGDYPKQGKDGEIEFYFDIKKDIKPTILEDGRVDFRNLEIIESVTAGQKLCGIKLPVPGTPGCNVYGTEVQPGKVKEAHLPRGKNVTVSEDGLYLISSIDGQVEYVDDKVNVFSSYEVPADVDNSTGNINFVGNVVVRGNVLSGFSIEAGGNVEVWGVVEGASIKAGGDIILRRGVQGMGKGTIISGGNIISRYIEHCKVEAKNNIKSEAIMHSKVKCGNKLELSGKKGLLVGGSCKVGKEISAKVIGSQMATATEIEVGTDPNLRERYKSLKEEMNSIETEARKADQAIYILKKMEKSAPLSPEKAELLAKSFRTKVHHTNRINEIKNELSFIEYSLQQEASGKIKCYGIVYSGTKITIGTCQMYVKDNLEYCTLYREGADIKVGPLER